MDNSYSDSDVSLSPSQVLERLEVLRQMQLFQRGKLQRQCLQYNDTPESSSSITEIVSHFSNSTSYNTFRSLLFSSNNKVENEDLQLSTSPLSEKLKEKDLIEGVSVLNLSKESEVIVNSPVSSRSKVSTSSKVENDQFKNKSNDNSPEYMCVTQKQLLDEMPILTTNKKFEALVIESIENNDNKVANKHETKAKNDKKTFLKRGEGLARFGLRKNDLVIQNTKALPWRNNKSFKPNSSSIKNKKNGKEKDPKSLKVKIVMTEPKLSDDTKLAVPKAMIKITKPIKALSETELISNSKNIELTQDSGAKNAPSLPENLIQQPVRTHPLLADKTKSWASIFTKEQDDFLRQLKQSEYYKNFASPAKSTISDVCCEENSRITENRESAEQKMFELIENKVTHDSFSIENSFFNKFLKRSHLETSGESTPQTVQKCLLQNPELAHIFPKLMKKHQCEATHSDVDSDGECCGDECSVTSSCCSCNTVEPSNQTTSCIKDKIKTQKAVKKVTHNRQDIENKKATENRESQSDTEISTMKANMAEMNEKLVATSELLKERLRELEDEIETFRKENLKLNKMREDVDMERQKFYEEKQSFEQKFNEEKIMSEYYLAEEKEKLSKQKQMYERYVREMRGRLNKKDKDEVVNLKKEISDLKEEIRHKDAKSTSIIARLRNQLKIIEKEKNDMHTEIEKLKKENKRIQHSNDITRRLSNMKYLEEINKKLTQMSNKNTKSEGELDRNMKYKDFEIERQSRSRQVQPDIIKHRNRAKSVPNLNVTSRYAKYFSQKDTISQPDSAEIHLYHSDNESKNSNCSVNEEFNDPNSEDENNLEQIYLERFQSTSPNSNGSNLSKENSLNQSPSTLNDNGFFVRKTSKSHSRDSKSPNNESLSPCIYEIPPNIKSQSSLSTHSQKSSHSFTNGLQKSSISQNSHRSKSPVSILSNRSAIQNSGLAGSQQLQDKVMAVTPDPICATNLIKSNLNPTEIKRPDGSRELRFPNGNIKYISDNGKYSKFVYYNGDVKETFLNEGRIKYFYAESKTFHTTHADGLEILEFPDGQVEKRYKDGSSEVRLPNGSVRYFDPKNPHVREEWRFPDGAVLTVAASGEQRINFANGQVEVHAKDHKRREFPDGTVKLVYNDGTTETRYSSGRVRIKDKHGQLIMDSATG